MPLNAKLNDINQIPLTEDMLRENGFEYDKYDCCYRLEGSDVGFEIGKVELCEKGCQDYFYVVYKCEFVHQLQNFLRTCGFVEYAENFKV